MKKILILGAGIEQLPGIKKAKEMGLYVITFDYNPNAIGFSFADESYVISTIDIEAALSKAKELRPDGVITLASDMPMRTVAAIGNELHLNTIDMQTAIKATDKAVMRRTLKENNVPVPYFFEVSSFEEYLNATNWFIDRKLRFITKPTDNAASRGVVLCDYRSDFKEVYTYSTSNSRKGHIMVEEYMEGPEVSVETIAKDGQVYIIAITDKLTSGAPYFAELGHSQPSRLSQEIQTKISDVVIRANQAIGIKNGPSHTEVIVTNEGPKIVEIGARLGGDNINTHLVPLSTGVDIVACVINNALGEPIDTEKKLSKGAAVRFFSGQNGTLLGIKGIEEAREIPGVIQIDAYVSVGDPVNELHSSDERLGCIIAQGETADQAIHICELGAKEIEFVIE